MKIYDIDGSEKGEISLPRQFDEPIYEDLVQRAVLAMQSHRRQRYGASPEAGKRASAKLSRRRRNYRGGYGHGISRVPRKILTRRGTQMYWVGAFAPGTVGGRRAHPPKSERVWYEKINDKERRKAIRSALAAVMQKEVVSGRGHKVPEKYPFIIDDSFQKLDKCKKVRDALLKLELKSELTSSNVKKTRAGKGKLRGRKEKERIGPLLVVSNKCKLELSARNLPGIDIVQVNKLNSELLAPGCSIGRLTLFTKSAIERMEKEKLFM